MERRDPDDIAKTIGLADRGTKRSLTRRKLAAAAAAGVVLAAFALWVSLGNGEKYIYTTKTASQGDIVVTVSATGTLQPLNEVDVGSELSGIVRVVEVDYNDRVRKGQVLARLDTAKLQARVQQSRAALETARAKLTQAQASLKENESAFRRLERLRELTGGMSPSRGDMEAAEAALDRSRADLASARAQILQAEATLAADEADLSKSLILSPIDGVVLKRSVEPGQTVAASLQAPVLFTMAEDLSKMELHVDVDEADIGEVHEGQEATFTVDAYPGRKFSARVQQVRLGAQASGSVVTYRAVLGLDNRDMLLRPGMTATADIIVRKVTGVVLVPNEALRFTPPSTGKETKDEQKNTSLVSKLFPRPPRETGKPRKGPGGTARTVWTIREKKLHPILIETGATDGTMTQVLKGVVQPGMALVVDAVRKKN